MQADNENSPDRSGFRFSPRINRAGEIAWQPWGDAPFLAARQQQKPVLLSISAVWCHWCHVMDETSLSEEEIIALINRSFIPVRIDSDRRPDINARFNNGGWPTVAVLTPEGEMIAGSTFMAAGDFMRFLTEVSDLYANNALEIEATLEQVRQDREKQDRPEPAEPGREIADGVLKAAAEEYDAENGGFGEEAKFPLPDLLKLLMVARLARGKEAEKMLVTTLDSMAAGDIRDRLEGGFFRYATRPDWSGPHNEKLLEDNALLMSVYADAYLLTGIEGYSGVVGDTYRYLTTNLLEPQKGAFGGSQDADADYYIQDAEGRHRLREDGVAPLVDYTIYAGSNAVAVSALLRCWQVFGDDEYLEQGVRTLEFIWDEMWTPAGLCHYHDGQPRLPGLLADTARLIDACLDAYECGAGEQWLDRALTAGRWALDSLEDADTGGFRDCASTPGDFGLSAAEFKPLVENGVMAAALVRLAQNTGQAQFGDAARRALAHFAADVAEFGIYGADFALAAERLLEPPVRVTVVGPPAEAPTREMIRAAHQARVPFRSVEVLDPETHAEELDATGYGYEGEPVAYICVGASCQPPVFSAAADLPARLETAWAQVRPSWQA